MFIFHPYRIALILCLVGISWSPNLWGDISEHLRSEQSEKSVIEPDPSTLMEKPSNSNSIVYGPTSELPDDPCLPPLYKDWEEFSRFENQELSASTNRLRIVIDRTMFNLVLEEMTVDGAAQAVYRTEVALGDLRSPTPEGAFIVNHIYCYQDVMFFSASHEKISNLYNGFFAPLLACDSLGKCQRFRELGIHGFSSDARPDPSIRPETFGAVSGGCIRLPDPCAFKRQLISRARVGPLRKNDRGSYHWLRNPIEVLIVSGYTNSEHTTGMSDVLVEGLQRLEIGFRDLLSLFGR